MPYGIATITYASTAIPGTASATVVAADATRRYLRIQNSDGTAAVWLRLGTAAAVAKTGIGLTAFGSAHPTYEAVYGEAGFWAGAVTAIGSGGTAILAVMTA